MHRVGQSLNNVKRGIKSWDVNRFMVYLLSSHPINNILNTQTTYENIISKGDNTERQKRERTAHRHGHSLNNVKRGINSWDVNRFIVYLLHVYHLVF